MVLFDASWRPLIFLNLSGLEVPQTDSFNFLNGYLMSRFNNYYMHGSVSHFLICLLLHQTSVVCCRFNEFFCSYWFSHYIWVQLCDNQLGSSKCQFGDATSVRKSQIDIFSYQIGVPMERLLRLHFNGQTPQFFSCC